MIAPALLTASLALAGCGNSREDPERDTVVIDEHVPVDETAAAQASETVPPAPDTDAGVMTSAPGAAPTTATGQPETVATSPAAEAAMNRSAEAGGAAGDGGPPP